MLMPERTASVSAPLARPFAWTSRISAEGWALVALTIVAALLRFATLTSQSFWVDEATTAHEMPLTFGALLHQVHVNETTPPLYFVVVWLWSKVFGSGAAGLRSFSALCGIALVPVIYLCGKELVSRAAGLIAAALAAFSPFLIWYSQEARAYMLLGLLSAASLLFCARAFTDPNRRNLVWWAAFSALAVMTHFFAGFLIAPEALVLLLTRSRTRESVVAVAAVAVVQLALLPLAISDTSHPLGWIKQFPLSVRVKQVPVDLSLGALYQSPLVSGGLVGAAVLLLVAVALLWIGGEGRERRGAAFAGGIGLAMLLAPLILAWLGHDYLVPRNFMPAWPALAVALAAACTVPRARLPGAALALVAVGAFVYSEARIERQPQYQRPNWKAVAAALGGSRAARAIVAYDGNFATQPLAIYLPRTGWDPPREVPVSISEVDVVGSSWQSAPRQLPDGVKLVSSHALDGLLVERFSVPPSWRLTPTAIVTRARYLLMPAPPAPAVLIQQASA